MSWRAAALACVCICALVPCEAKAKEPKVFSFYTFFQGEWDLEQQKETPQGDNILVHAHYSIKASGDLLEGVYYENSTSEDTTQKTNIKKVQISFTDVEKRAGLFEVATMKEDALALDTSELEVGEFETLFMFNFERHHGEKFWISQGNWRGMKDRNFNFAITSDSSFILTMFKASCTLQPRKMDEEKDKCVASTAMVTWTAAKPPPKPKTPTLLTSYGVQLVVITIVVAVKYFSRKYFRGRLESDIRKKSKEFKKKQ